MTAIDLGSDLLNYIIENELQPGDRIPPINELQDDEHLGISAGKVREQLEVARALGLVEVRSKTGMRIKDYSFTPSVRLSLLFALASNLNYFEMFSELRNHIEFAFWDEACNLLTDADKQAMWDCVHAAREKLNDPWIRIPHQEHRTFHLTVFKRLNNPFVTGLLEAYWDAYDAVQLNSYAEYDYLQEVWNYHETIIKLICDGDYDAARTAFVEHTRLLRYQSRIQTMKGEKAP